jgi:hypothetical protein
MHNVAPTFETERAAFFAARSLGADVSVQGLNACFEWTADDASVRKSLAVAFIGLEGTTSATA